MPYKRITVWIAIVAMVIAVGGITACGGSTSSSAGLGGGGSSAGGDSGGDTGGEEEAAPSPPTDAPIAVEFNSLSLNKSLASKSLSNFTSMDVDELDMVDNCNAIQSLMVGFWTQLDPIEIQPEDENALTYSTTIDGVSMSIETMSSFGGYDCSGNAVDYDICLKMVADGELLSVIVFEDATNFTQFSILNPDADVSSFSSIVPDPGAEVIANIKTVYNSGTISYDWSGNLDWDELFTKDLSAHCEVTDVAAASLSISSLGPKDVEAVNTYTRVQISRTDGHLGDDVDFNGYSNSERTMYRIGLLNALNNRYTLNHCKDESGVDKDDCIHDPAEDPNPRDPEESNPRGLVGAPTAVAFTVGEEELDITWTAPEGCTPETCTYNIYWGMSEGVDNSSNKITGATSPHTQEGLNNGDTYYYRVAAVSNGVEGVLSDEASEKPWHDLSGDMDTTYGTNGFSSLDCGALDLVRDMTIDSMDNTYLAGTCEVTDGSVMDMVVAKFTADGDLDITFGDDYDYAGGEGDDDEDELPDGYLRWNPDEEPFDADGQGIVVDKNDEDLFIVGSIWNFNGSWGAPSDYMLWNVLADTGSLDTSFFPPNGYFRKDDDDFTIGSGVERDEKNNIYVTGNYYAENMALWKMNIDGVSDITFGTDGMATVTETGGNGYSDHGYSIKMDPSDKIIVAGESYITYTYAKAVVWRFNQDGTLHVGDPTVRATTGFGGNYDGDAYDARDGYFLFDDTMDEWTDGEHINTHYETFDVAIGPNDNIWVVGQYKMQSGDDTFTHGIIWRLDPNGKLDTSFGAGLGYIRLSEPGIAQYARTILFDNYGRFMITGYAANFGPTIWRYRMVEGEYVPDTTIGENGYVNFDIGGTEYAYDSIHDSAGNLLFSGRVTGGTFEIDGDIFIMKVE